MVMVAVPVPGPPQVPGAVGHTSSAPESWMMKVAVLGSARAPLAVMTVATPERAMVMTAMAISRLPIERSFPLAGHRRPAAVRSTTVPAAWFPSCWARSGRARLGQTATPTAWAEPRGVVAPSGSGQLTLATWPRLGLVDGGGRAVVACHAPPDLARQAARPRSCHDRAGCCLGHPNRLLWICWGTYEDIRWGPTTACGISGASQSMASRSSLAGCGRTAGGY